MSPKNQNQSLPREIQEALIRDIDEHQVDLIGVIFQKKPVLQRNSTITEDAQNLLERVRPNHKGNFQMAHFIKQLLENLDDKPRMSATMRAFTLYGLD